MLSYYVQLSIIISCLKRVYNDKMIGDEMKNEKQINQIINDFVGELLGGDAAECESLDFVESMLRMLNAIDKTKIQTKFQHICGDNKFDCIDDPIGDDLIDIAADTVDFVIGKLIKSK